MPISTFAKWNHPSGCHLLAYDSWAGPSNSTAELQWRNNCTVKLYQKCLRTILATYPVKLECKSTTTGPALLSHHILLSHCIKYNVCQCKANFNANRKQKYSIKTTIGSFRPGSYLPFHGLISSGSILRTKYSPPGLRHSKWLRGVSLRGSSSSRGSSGCGLCMPMYLGRKWMKTWHQAERVEVKMIDSH